MPDTSDGKDHRPMEQVIMLRIESVAEQHLDGNLYARIFRNAIWDACDEIGVNVHTDLATAHPSWSPLRFEIEVSHSNWQKVLPQLTELFFFMIKTNRHAKIPAHFMPILSAEGPHLYPPMIVCAHEDVDVRSVSFGNILNNGMAAVHWQVEFHDRFGDPLVDQITMNLLFDQKCIEIFFTNSETKNGKPIDVKYQIKVDMTKIRRVIVDQSAKSSRSDIKAMRLLLEADGITIFTFPIEEKQGIGGRGGRNGSKRRANFSKKQRQLCIRRGRSNGEQSSDLLSECNLLILDLPIQPHLYLWLNRLHHCSKKTPEFADLQLIRLLTPNPADATAEAYRVDYVLPFAPFCKRHMDQRVEEACGPGRVDPGRMEVKIFRLRSLLEGLLQRGPAVKNQLLISHEHWWRFLRIVCHEYATREQKCLYILEQLLGRVAEPTKLIRLQSVLLMFIEGMMQPCGDGDMFVFSQEMEDKGFTRVHKVVVTPSRIIYCGAEVLMSNRVLNRYNHNGTNIIRCTFRDDTGDTMRKSTTGDHLIRATLKSVLLKGIPLGGRKFKYVGSSNSQLKDHGAYLLHETRWHSVESVRNDLGSFMELESVPKLMARLGQCFTQAKAAPWKLPCEEFAVTHDIVGGANVTAFEISESAQQILDLMKETASVVCDDRGLGVVEAMIAALTDKNLSTREMQSKITGLFLKADESEDVKKQVATVARAVSAPRFSVEQFDAAFSRPTPPAFTFSDGVGSISLKLAAKLYEDHRGSGGIPSAFQVRHGGAKGMLCVNATIDAVNEVKKKAGVPELQCLFRPSMNKFFVNNDRDTPIEVVKFSAPRPASLNRPLINILDQVSAMQSAACNRKVTARISELLDSQIQRTSRSLTHEKPALNRLLDMPFRGNIDYVASVFHLTTEPYHRLLLQAAYKCTLSRNLNKYNIEMPASRGRSMFGVIDWTGQLQYGQVFVRYSKELRGRSLPVIKTGTVSITKNPSTVAGDLRRYEAVDIPDLHGLLDVVVFPQHGPRPHPDEMAGSDLDGDEYLVMWDEGLFLERNEPAMVYPLAKNGRATAINPATLNEEMADCFTEIVLQEAVGVYGAAHLAVSDMYGINHPTPNDIAVKLAKALDYQKSGDAPAPLTTQWDDDKPPEKAERKPTYMQKHRDPCYRSDGIIGTIFEKIQGMLDVLDESTERLEIELDPDINCDGWREYEIPVRQLMEEYNAEIRNLLEIYGISSEAELLSGCILQIENRISDKEADDMSFYNTNMVIEERLQAIRRLYRERFFEEFGSDFHEFMIKWDLRSRNDENEEDIFDYHVPGPTASMKKKAAAAYILAYGKAAESGGWCDNSSRLLSFPWLFYDVLVAIKKDNRPIDAIRKECPIAEKLSSACVEVARDPDYAMGFNGMVSYLSSKPHGEPCIRAFMREYIGLPEAIFTLVCWAEREGLVPSSTLLFHRVVAPACGPRFHAKHLVLLLLQYGLGHYTTDKPHLFQPTGERREMRSGGGELLFEFISWLASKAFDSVKLLVFNEPEPIDCKQVFNRGEWRPLQSAAAELLVTVVLNHRVPLPRSAATMRAPALKECNPFVFELPAVAIRQEMEEVRQAILRQTQLNDVKLRPVRKIDSCSTVICSAVGSRAALAHLRHLVQVRPLPARGHPQTGVLTLAFPSIVYHSIMGRLPPVDSRRSSPQTPDDPRNPLNRNPSYRGRPWNGRRSHNQTPRQSPLTPQADGYTPQGGYRGATPTPPHFTPQAPWPQNPRGGRGRGGFNGNRRFSNRGQWASRQPAGLA